MGLFNASHFKTAFIATVWLCLAGLLFYFMSGKVNPNTAAALAHNSNVVLQHDLSSHYRAEAYINGVKTPAMVDTGATDVAISQALAD